MTLCRQHWLHSAEGVSTAVMHMPVVGGLSLPSPMPLHWVAQLADQHVSMPLPSATPLGCIVSQLVRQACTGSVPDDPEDVPDVPDEELLDEVVPLEPLLLEDEEDAELADVPPLEEPVESLLEQARTPRTARATTACT